MTEKKHLVTKIVKRLFYLPLTDFYLLISVVKVGRAFSVMVEKLLNFELVIYVFINPSSCIATNILKEIFHEIIFYLSHLWENMIHYK